MSEEEDDALVGRALAGDEGAFARLYARHAPRVARRLRSVLFSTGDVEDVLQMTFTEVHRRLSSFRRGESFSAWVFGISFHVTGRNLRSRRRKRWLSLASSEEIERRATEPEAAADSAVDERRLAERLRLAIEELRPDKRLAFALFEIGEMTLAEMSAALGESPKTLWSRVESARRDLQRALGDDLVVCDARRAGGDR